MGLINYTNLEDGTPVTANMFNQRFGQIISVINGGLGAENFGQGGIGASALAQSVYEKMYPIGSIYMNGSVETNPATLLGFGTWEQYASGRVPVGVDTAQAEFNAVGKTGGHKELQSHNHNGNTDGVGDHSHGFTRDVVVTSGSGNSRANAGSGQQLAWSQMGGTAGAGAHSHSFTTNSAGGGNAGNLQPFIAVYIWRRTG